MTIRDFLNEIDNLTGEEKKLAILSITKVLTPTSTNTLLEYQIDYASDPNSNWNLFPILLIEELKKCIFMEMSEEGMSLRKQLNIPLLTLESEI